MKTLSQILNSVPAADASLTEGTAWKIINTTLRQLGFEAATHGDLRGFKGIAKEDIYNLFGIPMRAGKWADVWFAILEDDYAVINDEKVTRFEKVGDAIKSIQHIAVQQKKNVSEETLEEKLSADDDAGVWISDFVKSTDPRFEGKSKKERIKMALGAYYAAQNEEVEEKLSTVYEDLEESFTAATASKITGAQIEKYLDSQNFKAIEQICKFMTKDELETWAANGYEGRTYELLMKSRLKNEEFEEFKEGLAQPFAVIDTGDNNIVVAMASSEAGAKSSIATSELPPMSVKDKNKLKIVRIKKKAMLGWPLNEGTQLDEEVDYYKFKQLAILGLLSPGDANKAALGMKAIEGGHPPTQEQKKIIGDTLVLLVDMITGDSAVLNKLKKTARDAKNATA